MRAIKYLLAILFSIAIAACGSGGGSTTTTNTNTPVSGKVTLSGTVATGMAIANATVTIKGANSIVVTATTDAFGKYPSTDVSTLTAPYLLKVTTAAGTNLYSVSTAGGTTNIHPFTDLIIRNWYKVKNSDVDAEFNGTLITGNIPTPTEINTIKAVVSNILSTLLAQEGISAFDVISTPFNADNTGFDKILDNTKVAIATTGSVTVTATDPTTGLGSTLVTTPITTTNLIIADTTNPFDPAGLTAMPSSTTTTTSILLQWTASTDNVGVAGYNIYRGATKIGTSPYPAYNDTGLTSGTQYCYQVEAFDLAGNVSAAKTLQACATPPATADITKPSVPAGLAATAASASQINLSWGASTDNVGVVGYDVYRDATKVATVNGTTFSDTGLSSSTTYSYTVVAKDAALNYSAPSTAALATTQIGTPSAPTGVSATASTGQATISWTAVSGATSYNIYMATQAGVTKLNGTKNPAATSPSTLTGLTNGTTYYFVVTAVNVAGESIESTQVSATPTAYSISGTVSGAAGVTITATNTTTSVAVTVTTASNGSYSVSGLANGTYNVVPSLTGYTFTPTSTSVTIAGGVNITGTNFTATASATGYILSGIVVGSWVEGVKVALSNGSTTTTNASGAYSFAGLPTGNYTVTPSLAGYTYSPTAPLVGVTANATQNFIAASATASFSISGTVTVSSAKTGPIYLRVYDNNCVNCGTRAGTTIATTGGAYTIRGLQPGTYSVNAEMDALGTGNRNANNPVGNSAAAVTITTANVPSVNVTVTDPAAPVPVAPTNSLKHPLVAFPSSGAAFISWDPPTDANGKEIATAYKIYWGTTTATTNTPIIVTAHQDGHYFQKGLTNGAVLYYKISACVGTTAIPCAAESAQSAVNGGASVTINATTGLNTVSGTVSFPGTASGGMLVGLFSPTGIYFTTIASPASPQSYSVAGIPAGNYFPFAAIDMNGNGIIDAGDLSNTNGNGGTITVGGNLTNNIALSAAGAQVQVNTDHQFDGTNHFYNLNMGVGDGAKRVTAVTLVSGPNMAVPFDLGKDWRFETYQWLNTTSPAVGDSYMFKVTYSDGTTENITGSVTAVLATGNMATGLVVNTATSRTVPTFTWAAPTTPLASYSYRVSLWGPGANWWYPNDLGLPSTTFSAVYNADGSAFPASLVTGTAYTWQVHVQDVNGNSASAQATYTP